MDLLLFNRTNENIEVTYLTKKNNSYRNNVKELTPGSYTITDIVPNSNVKIRVFSADQKVQTKNARYSFFDENTNKHIYQLSADASSSEFTISYEIDMSCTNNGNNSDDLLQCADDGFYGDCADYGYDANNCDCPDAGPTYNTCENCSDDMLNCDCPDDNNASNNVCSENMDCQNDNNCAFDPVCMHDGNVDASTGECADNGDYGDCADNSNDNLYNNCADYSQDGPCSDDSLNCDCQDCSDDGVNCDVTEEYYFSIEDNTSGGLNAAMYDFYVKGSNITWAEWLEDEDVKDNYNWNGFISLSSENDEVLFNGQNTLYIEENGVYVERSWTSTDYVPTSGAFYLNNPETV